MVFIIQLVK